MMRRRSFCFRFYLRPGAAYLSTVTGFSGAFFSFPLSRFFQRLRTFFSKVSTKPLSKFFFPVAPGASVCGTQKFFLRLGFDIFL